MKIFKIADTKFYLKTTWPLPGSMKGIGSLA